MDLKGKQQGAMEKIMKVPIQWSENERKNKLYIHQVKILNVLILCGTEKMCLA